MADWLVLWFDFITKGILIYFTWYLGKKGVTFYQQWKDDRTLRDEMIQLINRNITDFYGVMFEWNKFVDHVTERLESKDKDIVIDLDYEYDLTDKTVKCDVSYQLFLSRFLNNFSLSDYEVNYINDLSELLEEYYKFIEEGKDIKNWTKDIADPRKMVDDILEKLVNFPILIINTAIKR